MSLVFAAAAPHPPILVPNIGKDNLYKLEQTVKALKKLETELYAAKPDCLLVISPHGVVLLDAFLINLCDQYVSDFEQFGDFATKLEFQPNLKFVEDLKMAAEGQVPLTITSEPKLDHGVTVPLYYLTQHLSQVSLVPISYSLLDYANHLLFGELLKDKIVNTNERIAVIASGDLSHRLTKDAPAGYSPQGAEFDQKVMELLKQKDLDGLLALKPELVEAAGECGLRSLFILLGILKNINYQTEILSYEGPFGVGYMVANFDLQ